MGTKGKAIVGMDVDKLVGLLNKAFADEWLAYYQYWIGAKIAVGPMRDGVIAELEQHATEEFGHSLLLVNRIIQLGGTPILKPEDWYKETNCGYDAPEDPSVFALLDQNIKGEQCAIMTYQGLLTQVKDKDYVTYNMLLGILSDEVTHEEDLQAIVNDLDEMGRHWAK